MAHGATLSSAIYVLDRGGAGVEDDADENAGRLFYPALCSLTRFDGSRNAQGVECIRSLRERFICDVQHLQGTRW